MIVIARQDQHVASPDRALRPGSWSYGTRHVRWARGAVIADEGSDGRPRLIQTDSPLAA